jgi:predicted metal-binding membrane protein
VSWRTNSAPVRGYPAPTLAAAVLATTAAAWLALIGVVKLNMADGGWGMMSAAPFLGSWVLMMAAMMLPAALPMLSVYQHAVRSSRGVFEFVGGYALVWTAFGAAAYLVARVAGLGSLGRPAAAGVLGVAALYEALPLKDACLRRCRSPVSFLVRNWRAGPLGALRMGAAHGASCVGCCTGLMLVLFALGLMSLAVMVVLSVVILAEKVASFGWILSRLVPPALAALAIVVMVSPGAFEWLT